MPTPVLVIHGGAGRALSEERHGPVQVSISNICRQVHGHLLAGGTALDAVTNAVRRLEDDPLFNAGTGSKLQVDGGARLSASIMDGPTRRFAGCVNVEGLLNPILLSRALLDDDDRVLAGQGALTRARQLRLDEGEVRTPQRLAEWRDRLEGRTGTVGAVALDRRGQLAAATSTGGRGFEAVGRVSDSPTVAATFATDAAAVSLTGVGEHIVDGGMAVRLVTLVEAGLSLGDAADRLLADMEQRRWEAGFIAVDHQGRLQARHSTPGMSWWTCGPAEAGFSHG